MRQVTLVKNMMVIKNQPSKMKFFWYQGIFFVNFDFKNKYIKMNLTITTKNHAADSKIGSPLKIDFRADWTHESNPTAWELIKCEFGFDAQFSSIGRSK